MPKRGRCPPAGSQPAATCARLASVKGVMIPAYGSPVGVPPAAGSVLDGVFHLGGPNAGCGFDQGAHPQRSEFIEKRIVGLVGADPKPGDGIPFPLPECPPGAANADRVNRELAADPLKIKAGVEGVFLPAEVNDFATEPSSVACYGVSRIPLSSATSCLRRISVQHIAASDFGFGFSY
jgi:hypothetical protein